MDMTSVGQTKIEWTDFTVNFWEGCQKVGPGCDHCYAEARDFRFTGGAHWGPGAPRRKVKGGIAKLRKIQSGAAAFAQANGRAPRVFCSSLSDVFDNAVDPAWRAEAFAAIEAAPAVRVQLLTKRVLNVQRMVPPSWQKEGGWPGHVGLMITVVNQAEADRYVPVLLALKEGFSIPWVGLSIEPMLGPVRLDSVGSGGLNALDPMLWGEEIDRFRAQGGDWELAFLEHHDAVALPARDEPVHAAVDWVICGGESGPQARAMHPDWVRSLRDQCAAAGAAFLFKQWGEWLPREIPCKGARADVFVPLSGSGGSGPTWPAFKAGRRLAGRMIDGVTHDEFPEALS